MDPDACLAELRELRKVLEDSAKDDYAFIEASLRMTELVQALDEWLSNGGFQPRAWRKDG